MRLYNYMEDVVIKAVDLAIEKCPQVCKCEKCRLE